MAGSFDAIIIGAGHNGLVTACYLARAGWKVLVLERRHVVGGACVTEEVFPGFKVSTAAYVNSLFRKEIIRDLRLADYGFAVLERNPSSFTPFPDGRILLMGADRELTLREIAKFSERDAENYPKYEAMLERVADVIEPTLLHAAAEPAPARPARPVASVLAGPSVPEDGSGHERGRRGPDRAGPAHPRSLVRVGAIEGDPGHRRHHRRHGGPEHAGHRLRPVPSRHGRNQRQARRLGLCQGRHGRADAGPGPVGHGAVASTSAPRPRWPGSWCRTARRRGVALANGEEFRARVVASNADAARDLQQAAGQSAAAAGLRRGGQPHQLRQRLAEDQRRPVGAAATSPPARARSRDRSIAAPSTSVPTRTTSSGPTTTPSTAGPRNGPILECTLPSAVDPTRGAAGQAPDVDVRSVCPLQAARKATGTNSSDQFRRPLLRPAERVCARTSSVR